VEAWKRKSSTGHMDETLVRVAGRWRYLFRAVDRSGPTVDFYRSVGRAGSRSGQNLTETSTVESDHWPPSVFARDGLRSDSTAIRELQGKGHLHGRCRPRTRPYRNHRIESDHRHGKRRLGAMPGPRTAATAWVVIQGIEAAKMIRKGQVLGLTQQNLHGQAWLFGFLLEPRQATASTNDWSRLLRRRYNTSPSICFSHFP
jgi:transposase-like protein